MPLTAEVTMFGSVLVMIACIGTSNTECQKFEFATQTPSRSLGLATWQSSSWHRTSGCFRNAGPACRQSLFRHRVHTTIAPAARFMRGL